MAGQGSKRLSTSQILREIAEDYHNMAKEAEGKADYMRTRNYLWLLKLGIPMKVIGGSGLMVISVPGSM
jgi:hypothetical protein